MQSTARSAALKALERCRRNGAWSGASIDSVISSGSLDRREAALAAKLCLGVLQNTELCDFYIDSFVNTGLEPKVRDILRIGTYQLLMLDRIPARAAVNESVQLCRDCGFARAAGLVNAVLRKIADTEHLPEIPGKGSAEYLHIKYSHPIWLINRLISENGYDHTEQFLAANNSVRRLNIQVNTLKISTDDYCAMLDKENIAYIRAGYPDGCLELAGGNVTLLPGYDDGLFYVQDKAARLAAEAAGAESGMRVIDVCAAPGGKSFACAIRMHNEGQIISCDIHEKKLSLICSGAERLGIGIITAKARDARRHEEELCGEFDLVIADVPCSGIGVIGRKPEIRQKKEAEAAALPEIQREILASCAELVRPGGALLYSTCTVLQTENEDIIKSFLADNTDFSLEAYPGAETGMHTFWPHIDGTDGFFAARLRRKE